MKGILVEENLEEIEMKDTEDEQKQTEVLEVGEENIETGDETKFKKSKKANKSVKEKMKLDEKENKKRWIKIIVIVSLLILIALFVSTIFAIVNINNEKIISGISIKGIDMSGLTKDEAKAKLEIIYNEKKEKDINIKYQDYESSLNPTLMETNFDIEKAVEEAYLVGKGDNIFINNYDILFTLINKKDFDIDMTLNENVARQSIEDIGTKLPGLVIESSYSIENEELIITKGIEGIKIDTDKLLSKVKDVLNDINKFEGFIEIPVIDKKPEEIDIDKIHGEVYKEVQDAYYTKDPFTVYPEVIGVDFNVDEAKALIAAEDKQEYSIKLLITKPKITIDQIGTEAFPDQLATTTTRYDATATDRTTNLKIACQKINGKVILAGETFSYNQTLGARTAAAGYKNAKVYEAGQVVDGIGGGICQISSTLYNSALKANLQIVERTNHQFVTSYLPAGMDATVVYGAIDFKFKNTRQYPVKIVASCQSGIATVSIYGIKEENEYTFNFTTKQVATIPFTTKYVDDASLAPGQEQIKQKGVNGIKTETYMTKSLNGKVISTTLLSKDTYDAMTKIVLRGKQTTTLTPVPAQTTPAQVPETTPAPVTPEISQPQNQTTPESGQGSTENNIEN